MVICCVPGCSTDSWKCDASVTFYDFPANHKLKVKWIRQINTALKWKTSWFPSGRPVLCSKHFLHTDFKGDTDALKPRSIPSVFGHKYIGQDPQANEADSVQKVKTSPLIVKVLRPKASVSDNDSDSRISKTPQTDFTNNSGTETETVEADKINLQTSSHENSHLRKNHLLIENSSCSHQMNQPSNMPLVIESVQRSASKISHNTTHILSSNAISASYSLKDVNKKIDMLPKKNVKKRESNADLIEIGPNTFLKINPDVIKVNKKQTPSGNTVLQFVMDQKLAKNYPGDVLPKLVQDVSASSIEEDISCDTAEDIKLSNKDKDVNADSCNQKEKVQHVLGHVVDNHICEDSCVDLTLDEHDTETMDETQNELTCKSVSFDEVCVDNQDNLGTPDEQIKDASSKLVLDKAPVLLTTNMPLNHCFIDRPKYILQLKQKNRQIASLKLKLANLNKKIEELEDRCIVQERQLSYSFVKRLKTIQKNAAKGDPCATYILEQIRSYSYVNNSKMRWSDSTLTQCAIWCRKAPYAYEYFKKAGFFKLPCLGTVKRFMKKHPEIKFQKSITKSVSQDEGSESSSDFDFDESDTQNNNGLSEDENDESATCENILSEMAETIASRATTDIKSKNKENNEIQMATESIANHSPGTNIQDSVEGDTNVDKTTIVSKCLETNGIPITVDTSNLELQEIILPSGEVVQCYSSNVVGSAESGQYFIIPNVSDQSNAVDHEYNVIQADSMPVILQNIEENSQLAQQDQLIFVAKSSDHVECSETEVTSA